VMLWITLETDISIRTPASSLLSFDQHWIEYDKIPSTPKFKMYIPPISTQVA
jgi:hypothetical protein